MFSLFNHAPKPGYPTIRQALVDKGVPSAADPSGVALVEMSGQYSGRRVNFFRAFEPGLATARSIPVRSYGDLDAHPDLLVGSGHVERGGMVVVNRLPRPDSVVPARAPANRADHPDDERLVFWDAELARSSEATLSAPAATWLHARATPFVQTDD